MFILLKQLRVVFPPNLDTTYNFVGGSLSLEGLPIGFLTDCLHNEGIDLTAEWLPVSDHLFHLFTQKC